VIREWGWVQYIDPGSGELGMKMGQKDGKREGEATSSRRLSLFHLLLFRILPTLPQLTVLSPNALAISQSLRPPKLKLPLSMVTCAFVHRVQQHLFRPGETVSGPACPGGTFRSRVA
jgi:hypothetical protein